MLPQASCVEGPNLQRMSQLEGTIHTHTFPTVVPVAWSGLEHALGEQLVGWGSLALPWLTASPDLSFPTFRSQIPHL